MKKLCSLLLIFLLFLSFALTAYGAQEPPDYVVDYAGLLTDAEEEALQQRVQESKAEFKLDIVIVTIYGTGSKNVQEYADDFYDQNGYGYGANKSGILLLLDMEAREWYMSTCGDAIYIFTDYGLSLLGDAILPQLSEGDYSGAFHTWLDSLSPFVDAYRNHAPIDGYVQPDDYESPYGDETVYYQEPLVKHPFLVALIIGLAVSAAAVLIMAGRMNTAKFQKGAQDYLKSGSFRLRQRSDMFLYSRVTRRAKPKENTPGGGGSSVHRSSGGVRHGGRGGKF